MIPQLASEILGLTVVILSREWQGNSLAPTSFFNFLQKSLKLKIPFSCIGRGLCESSTSCSPHFLRSSPSRAAAESLLDL